MYSIDTSAVLDGWVRYYPPDVFGTVWTRLAGLGTTGRLFASDEVISELEKKDDGAWRWAKQHLGVVPIDAAIQVAVAGILASHQRLVDTRKNRSQADPFVIGLAQIRNFAVVTGERPTGKPDRPHIPDVCNAMNIKCINLLELFREQGWQL